jgi:hypothetical protein
VRPCPDVPSRRTVALLGLTVHDAVDRLAVLGEGVNGTGSAPQSGFDAAADKVDSAPVVSSTLADGLRGAGEGTGGSVVELGARGESSARPREPARRARSS